MLNRIKSETILIAAALVALIFLTAAFWLINNKAVVRNEKTLFRMDVETKNIASLHLYLDLYYHTGNRAYPELMGQKLEEVSRLSEQVNPGGSAGSAITALSGKISQTLDAFKNKGIKFIEPRYSDYQRISRDNLLFNTAEIAQLEAVKADLYNLQRLSDKLLDQARNESDILARQMKTMTRASLAMAALILLLTLLDFRKRLFIPLQNLIAYAGNISDGKPANNAVIKNRDLLPVKDSLDRIAEHITHATDFAVRIGEGRLDVEDRHINSGDLLGKALIDMRNKLKSLADEEDKRKWAINGEAKFGELFRQHQHAGIEELSYQFIFNLVKYVGANQGAVFLLNAEQEEEPFIEMTACYAYERKKRLEKKILPGEGLVGQCMLEKDVVYLEEVPENYINITSGLGRKTPTCVLLAPLKVGEELFGAIELAYFKRQDPERIEFVKTVCESFSATLSGAKMTAQTQKLLENSQALNQEMQQQEELMRQNAEELQAIQEELNRKLKELEEETNLSKNIVEAINKTNATIEFDMDGVILDVNDMYLSVMGYSREELIGKNEMSLAPQDEIDSHRFRMLWDSLKGGTFMSGEYRRLAKDGREVWLNGAYNPIFNLAGEPYKIIQLAQFTTEEKEKDLDMSSKINAIGGAFPIIEVDLAGRIKTANQTFMDLLGYKRSEFREKELAAFVDEKAIGSASAQSLFSASGEASNMIIPYLTREGKRIFCLTIQNPIRNLSGEVYKNLIILVNFSEQKSLETRLKENNRKLSNTLDTLQDAQVALDLQKSELDTHIDILNESAQIIEVDPEGRIIRANEAACRQLQRNEQELTSRSIDDLLGDGSSDAKLADSIRNQAETGRIARISLVFKKASGDSYPSEVAVAPIASRDGKHIKTIMVLFGLNNQGGVDESPSPRRKNSFFHWEEDTNSDLIQAAITRLLEHTTDHESLDQIAGSGLIPVMEVANTGEILDISSPALQLLGLTKKESHKMRLDELLDSFEAAFPQGVMERLLSGKLTKYNLTLRLPDGGREATLLSMPIFTDGDGAGMQILVFLILSGIDVEQMDNVVKP